MLPPDIEPVILESLQAIFAQELQQDVATDALALRVCKQGPLQDDPTTAAPYLVYTKDPDQGARRVQGGEEEREYGSAEIGGPNRYLIFFTATIGTPLSTNKEDAQVLINTLCSRAMDTIARHYDLAGVLVPGQLCASPNGKRYIEGNNTYLIKNATTRVYGGENTWYGESKLWWLYPVSWEVG